MEEKFKELMEISSKLDERAELEKGFLSETIESLSSTDKEKALETASKFDKFKKDAESDFYSRFFGVLSKLIKRKYLDRDEDLAATNLKRFSKEEGNENSKESSKVDKEYEVAIKTIVEADEEVVEDG